MNFELKVLDLAAAALDKCEALVVLVGTDFKPGKDSLGALWAHAVKAGDIESKAGKALMSYRPATVAAGRPPVASAQVRAFSGDRLKPVTSCPA